MALFLVQHDGDGTRGLLPSLILSSAGLLNGMKMPYREYIFMIYACVACNLCENEIGLLH